MDAEHLLVSLRGITIAEIAVIIFVPNVRHRAFPYQNMDLLKKFEFVINVMLNVLLK